MLRELRIYPLDIIERFNDDLKAESRRNGTNGHLELRNDEKERDETPCSGNPKGSVF